jgi:4-hydroxythreonine-4-phosphate dehydrogenase
VVADDLSGAAEVAGTLLARGRDCEVVLDGRAVTPAHDGLTTVVDTDHRAVDPASARSAVRAASAAAAGPTLVVVKLDSLWRGNVTATVEALHDNGFQVVVAGALPSLGRTVREGRPFVGDVPLADTALWALEPHPAPRAVADLLDGLLDGPVSTVPLAVLRAGWALGGQELSVLDGETDADLRAAATVAVDAVVSGRRVALVGSAALVAAVADTTSAPPSGTSAPAVALGHRPVVLAVGSGSAAATAQTAHLRAAALVDEHTHLLTIDPAEPVADLARRVGRTHPAADLVLTGGQTARAVLDHLGVRRLRPVAQPEHGIVVSLTDDGRLVATKPGSFGQDPTLTDLVRLLRALRSGVPTAPQEIP